MNNPKVIYEILESARCSAAQHVIVMDFDYTHMRVDLSIHGDKSSGNPAQVVINFVDGNGEIKNAQRYGDYRGYYMVNSEPESYNNHGIDALILQPYHFGPGQTYTAKITAWGGDDEQVQ